MEDSSDSDNMDELEKWGVEDAIWQTELLQTLPKSEPKFEFIKPSTKRKVSSSTCSLEEFALTKHVMQLISRPNSATYVFENVNYKSASNDFKKFITFIETYPEPGKAELSSLVFPVFVHFYLLLLQYPLSGHLDAQTFFNQNKEVFACANSYDNILKTLYSFRSIEDVRKDSYYKKFLENKYIIGMCPDVLKDLKQFIISQAEEPGEKALLYVLHFHIFFQDDDEIPESDELDDSKSDFECSNGINVGIEFSEISESDHESAEDISLESIESEIINLEHVEGTSHDIQLSNMLEKLNINHPRISSVVTKSNENAKVCSVDFNDAETEIAYAVGSNCIYISPMQLKKEKSKRLVADDKMKRNYEEVAKRSRSGGSREDDGSKEFEALLVQKHVSEEICNERSVKAASTSLAKCFTRIKDSENAANKHNVENVGRKHEFARFLKEVKTPEYEKVCLVKYLPKMPFLLLAACDLKVRTLNTKTLTFVAEFEVGAVVFDIDIDSTCQYFATASSNTTSSLYTFDQDTEIHRFIGHRGTVTAVQFHPNGLYIATGSQDCTIRLFDVESGLCLRCFYKHRSDIEKIVFSPDGKLLASGDILGVVKVWDIKDGSEISEVCFGRVIEIRARITSLCFHANNTLLAACNDKGEMKVWNIRNPKNLKIVNFKDIPMKIKFTNTGLWKIASSCNPEKYPQ